MDKSKIIAAAAYAGMTQSEVAEKMGMSISNWSQRIGRCSFKDDELERIAAIIGAKYEARFVFEDGTRI